MGDCKWYCKREKRCHANACPDLWGGEFSAPCGHGPDTGQRHENIARALFDAHETDLDLPERWTWDDASDGVRGYCRRLADAAIAADGLEARVQALAAELERLPGDMTPYVADVAKWVRALLDGPDTGRRS